MHGHDHDHTNGNPQNRVLLALLVTAAYMVTEFLGGLWFNSLALMADAGHMLSDVFALALSFAAMRVGNRSATDKHTFGFKRSEVLAALLNGLLLWGIAAVIIYEALHRFFEAQPVAGGGMLVIASIGLMLNLAVAALLYSNRDHNLNLKSAFMHVIADALGSVGAILAGIVIIFTGAYWVDPLTGIGVALLILYSSWYLVKESVLVLMEGVPSHLSLSAIEQSIISNPNVCCVHDLHVWSISGNKTALSAHVILMDHPAFPDAVLSQLRDLLHDDFGIEHTTIQIERFHSHHGAESGTCRPGTQCSAGDHSN